MCGIFAIVSNKKDTNAAKSIFEGLKRLDYRGYDSWGIAVHQGTKIHSTKRVGEITKTKEFGKLPKSTIGIGHTRWATHGSVTHENAHPHYSSDKKFALAQNGIVENYQNLKSTLKKKGHKFLTDTDTEVIVRLIEEKQKSNQSLLDSVRTAFLELKGRNTIILITTSGEIIAARNGSPLVVGLSENQREIFLSSDTLSFAPHAKKMIIVDNGQLIHYNQKTLDFFNIKNGQKLKKKIEKLDIKSVDVDKAGFDHFMIKEIYESPFVIQQVINQDETKINDLVKAIKKARNIYTLASGTTGLAAAQIAYYLRQFAKIRAVSLIGAEAKSYFDLFSKEDLIIAPSQSGETADVLEVLEHAEKKGVKIATYVNMPGSAMTRMSDYPFMSGAGPEICVMSTKVFTCQISWGYLLSKATAGKLQDGQKELVKTADAINRYLNNKSNHTQIKKLARKLIKANNIFLLGKSQNLQIIMEGMVKIIEGTYIHAHGIPAGDLKHYAITIMEKGVPVIVVVSNDDTKSDVINAVNEVKAREATVIGFASQQHESFDEFIKIPDLGETSAILNVVPLQLLAYYMTVQLGHNVDKPRNIAKSVTVK